MKTFISFIKKEFLHILRDKTTMLILFAMPVVMIILFSYAISTDVKNISVAVWDLSKDSQTQRIINELAANKYFTVKEYLHLQSDIDKAFKEDRINLVVVFSENFAENMQKTHSASVQLLADGTEANSASMYIAYAQGVLVNYLKNINDNAVSVKNAVEISTKMLYNPQNKSEYNFVPGVMGLMLLLINAMMSSIAIVREKESGTMEMLLASPMPPLQIILAKTVPYFTLSSLTLAIILLFSVFVLNVPIAGSLILLILLCLLYIFVALAMGLLISTVVSSQMLAMLISGMVLMMPTMLLSGMMFPIESMPKILQYISCIVPARWFISAIKKVMIQGVSLQFVQTELTILVVMAVLFVTVAVKRFKIRLE